MSFNMYLGSIPKVDGYSFQELIDYEERVHDSLDVLPEDLKPLATRVGMTRWYTLTRYIGGWADFFSIHDWFIGKIIRDKGSSLPYIVDKDELMELKKVVTEVLFDNISTGTHKVAEEKLYSHYELSSVRIVFDEDFYNELRRTLYILDEALRIDFNNNYVYYQADYARKKP